MRVAVAFDHRGVKLRERVLEEVVRAGHEPVDLGTDKSEPMIDYPDKALEVAATIRSGEAERAILVCGSGVGASVAASKLAGIRAATCHDTYSAHQGVEHDDMNVLCIGSGVVGPDLAAELVQSFLGARFDGGERYDFMGSRSSGNRSGSTRCRAAGSRAATSPAGWTKTR
jgi:ribose 5-phosphate isomerase B